MEQISLEREQLDSFEINKPIYSSKYSEVSELTDGRILKVVTEGELLYNRANGASYEKRILDTRARSVPEIVSPITAVYNGDVCCGYTSEKVNGIQLKDYRKNDELMRIIDLYHFFDLYSKIENVVISANSIDIVIPDLCSGANIIVLPDGNLKFIDYDGMQVGCDDKMISYSTILLPIMNRYLNSIKFCSTKTHFTSEVDKMSLTVLMFWLIFGVIIPDERKINFGRNGTINMKRIFEKIGLSNEVEFMNKVEANMSLSSPGVFLQDELYRIVENYEMYLSPAENGECLKRLRPKKK